MVQWQVYVEMTECYHCWRCYVHGKFQWQWATSIWAKKRKYFVDRIQLYNIKWSRHTVKNDKSTANDCGSCCVAGSSDRKETTGKRPFFKWRPRVSNSLTRSRFRLFPKYDANLKMHRQIKTWTCKRDYSSKSLLIWLRRVCGCQRKHCMLMICIKQRLTIIWIVNDEILFEKLSNNIGAILIAEIRCLRCRYTDVVGNIKTNLWR